VCRGSDSILVRAGEKPVITTLGGLNTIFIVKPNENIIYRIIKLDVGVVDDF
jgi:hypothetical protein